MELLLRQLRKLPDGQLEYQDTELAADELLIGSAPHCQIQWVGEGIAPRHASLHYSAGGATLKCRRGCRINVNGQPSAGVVLRVGDELQLGPHRLRLMSPPSGFQLALEIETSTTAASLYYESAFRTSLRQTWLPMRSASWALLALTLLLTLAMPLYSVRLQRAGQPVPAAIVTDRIWTAGPLLAAHQLTTAATCISCHQSLFVHVQDRACRSCHKGTVDHVSGQELLQRGASDKPRCASCHLEHGGSSGHLLLATSKLCTGCHGSRTASAASLDLPAISGFAAGAHPDWQAVAAATGLKFSHAQHLDVERVRTLADRRALVCADCHRLAPDGAHFVPITMEHSCRSCHELTFDDGQSQRQLPHGNASDAISLIQDYFARRAVDPAAAGRQPARRRMPDPAAAQRCEAAAFECATRAAAREIVLQFEQQGCVICHSVTSNGATDPLRRYAIRPVSVGIDLLPSARFRHTSHLIMAGKSGDAACLSCHDAPQSSSAVPSMVPRMNKCLGCHDTSAQPPRLPLQCMSCHSYHPASIPGVVR
jgi:predicted CXXCH cytochrome family protein